MILHWSKSTSTLPIGENIEGHPLTDHEKIVEFCFLNFCGNSDYDKRLTALLVYNLQGHYNLEIPTCICNPLKYS